MERINSVSEYIELQFKWATSLMLLREVILGTQVKECVKWNAPTYTFDGENILGLAAFKEYVGIWFHQGVFLKDRAEVLFNANKIKTKGLRQWRFSNVSEIEENLALIEKYILEAIENQKIGKKIKFERGKTLNIPPELQNLIENSEEFNVAFFELSKSKQIEYADYISEAKQIKTKQRRLEKINPMVKRNEGLNDKYRSK